MAIAEVPERIELWRISNFLSLNGIGALRRGGRWNAIGHAVVYLAGEPSGALLETLVHLTDDDIDMPDSYRLLRVVGSGCEVKTLAAALQIEWREDIRITQQMGDKWIEEASTVLARVPSILVPYTWNYLLNPAHPDANKMKVEATSDHLYDPRLLRS